MFKRLIGGALVFGLAATAPPVAATQQIVCGPRAAMIDHLVASYDETLSGAGLLSAQMMFEVWTSEATGSWTILSTGADGTSCLMASGTYWEQLKQLPESSRVAVPVAADGRH